MTHNDEGNMNPQENNSLLKYNNDETSPASLNDSVSRSEGVETTSEAAPPTVQFKSRKERRMSETSMMQVVPPATKVPSLFSSVPEIPSAPVIPKTPRIEEINTAQNFAAQAEPKTISKVKEEAETPVQPEEDTKPSEKEKTVEQTPKETSVREHLKQQLAAHHPKNNKAVLRASKEYWGGTAMLTSFSAFLIAQLVFVFVLIGYVIMTNKVAEMQGGTEAIQEVTTTVPFLLISGTILMYIPWLGSLWWVTKYRSGVQAGKKFWNAFKDNFRLNNFKKRDIAYGAGMAGALFGLQMLVLNGIPALFPELKETFQASDNASQFQAIEGIWFYVFAFGFVAFLGPICEELFFRGFLLRGFENHFSYKNSGRNMDMIEDGLAAQTTGLKSMMVAFRSFTHKNRHVLAIIISSLLFGLMHFNGTSWITVVMTGILGLVFAIVTVKLNRMYPAIFGHIFHNAIVAVILTTSR